MNKLNDMIPGPKLHFKYKDALLNVSINDGEFVPVDDIIRHADWMLRSYCLCCV